MGKLLVGEFRERITESARRMLVRRHAPSVSGHAITKSPDYQITKSPNHQITKSPNHQIRGPRESGFTIIELMVVLALIMTLAAMGVVQYKTSITRSKEAVLKEDLFRMRDAIDQYYADKGQYPSALDALVSDGYMRAVPVDPFTNSKDSWQTVPSEPDPNNPTAPPGIYDVKSGSEASAIDGTKYAEW